MNGRDATAGALDDIRNQVMWTRLVGVVEEQARSLIATAFSAVVRESGDLSCGVFDPEGRMLAQAVTGTPGHVNSMAQAVVHFLARFPAGSMAPGDHFITNDPWLASGHLHDVTVVTPVFRGDRLVALFAATCHQVDIGGLGQGPDGRSIYEEGLQIPLMRLARRGALNEDLFEIIRANVRAPDQVEGDILSYMTANEAGGRQLGRMMDEFGLDDLAALGAFIFDRSQTAMREAIRALPDGTWRNRLTLAGYREPVEIVTAVTVDGDRISVDYAGSSPASAQGINLVLNYTRAYTAFGLRCVVAPEVPNNAGSLAPIEISAPEDSILNVARPRPVCARHIIGQFLPDAVLGCLAQAVPDRVPAEGASCVWGIQLRGGPEVDAAVAGGAERNWETAPYDLIFFNSGGAGARPGLDGLSATAFPSGVRAMPIEVVETQGPIVVWRKELLPDSGGAGRTRGGLGQRIEVASTDGSPFAVFAMYDRTRHPARGRAGGGDGRVGRVGLLSGGTLNPMGMQIVPPGDGLWVELPGGGGYGDPAERDPAATDADRRDGLVGGGPVGCEPVGGEPVGGEPVGSGPD